MPCSLSAYLVLSAGNYLCAACDPHEGEHERDFVLDSGLGCNSVLLCSFS